MSDSFGMATTGTESEEPDTGSQPTVIASGVAIGSMTLILGLPSPNGTTSALDPSGAGRPI